MGPRESGAKQPQDRAKAGRTSTTDNLCKYLAESYPEQFASWALRQPLTTVEVLKTELSDEPIRADSVVLLNAERIVLHLEFQVEVNSDPPLPLRMLDYWVRLYRQHRMTVRQVLVMLKPTTMEIPTEFRAERTWHSYDIVKLWEQDPQALLDFDGLIPLAVLARASSADYLLAEVADRINQIQPEKRRRELSNCAQVLAGLRFDKELVHRMFKEGVMRESVIYQEIVEEGLQQGLQQGLRQEAVAIVLRLITHRFGSPDVKVRERIEGLSVSELEYLSEALLDFNDSSDLTKWLDERDNSE